MKAYAWLGIAIAAIVLALLAYFGWGKFVDFIQAPVKAQLETCRANQAAMEESIGKQNTKIGELQKEADRRRATSEAAVKKAGNDMLAAADRILKSGALDPDACRSASLRVNKELGLK